MRRVLFIAILVLTVAPMGEGQKQSARDNHRTSVEEVIKKLDNERIQAQIQADATALDRIYAADFIGVGPSGRVRTKPQVISDFTSGDLKFQSITTDEVQVRVYGNTAVETGRSIMIGEDKGQTVPPETRFTRVWVKQQGGWRLVANHYSTQTMAGSSTSSEASRQVAEARHSWLAAFKSKDVGAAVGFYASDAAFLQPSGERIEGIEAIRELYQKVVSTFDTDLLLRSRNLEVSANLAYDSGEYEETLTNRATGQTQRFHGQYIMIFRLSRDGHWKIIQHAWTVVPNPV